MLRMLAIVLLVAIDIRVTAAADQDVPLQIATFRVDATPPLGSPLCDGAVPPVSKIDDPLTARGLVLLNGDSPIVLCAVDWVGIGNAGHTAWRQALAEAAGTSIHRVAVQTLHQHDAGLRFPGRRDPRDRAAKRQDVQCRFCSPHDRGHGRGGAAKP